LEDARKYKGGEDWESEERCVDSKAVKLALNLKMRQQRNSQELVIENAMDWTAGIGTRKKDEKKYFVSAESVGQLKPSSRKFWGESV